MQVEEIRWLDKDVKEAFLKISSGVFSKTRAKSENISPTNEDTHSGNTGKDYSTMKPQAVETVHTTGAN